MVTEEPARGVQRNGQRGLSGKTGKGGTSRSEEGEAWEGCSTEDQAAASTGWLQPKGNVQRTKGIKEDTEGDVSRP